MMRGLIYTVRPPPCDSGCVCDLTLACWGRFVEMFNKSYETYALQGVKRKANAKESGPTMVI